RLFPFRLSRHHLMLLTLRSCSYFFFFFNDTATTEIYTLSLHDALPIFRLFLLVLILLLMPTLNFLPVWFALSLLRFRLPKANQRSEERFSRNAETDLVCRLLLEKKKNRFGCVWFSIHANVAMPSRRRPHTARPHAP